MKMTIRTVELQVISNYLSKIIKTFPKEFFENFLNRKMSEKEFNELIHYITFVDFLDLENISTKEIKSTFIHGYLDTTNQVYHFEMSPRILTEIMKIISFIIDSYNKEFTDFCINLSNKDKNNEIISKIESFNDNYINQDNNTLKKYYIAPKEMDFISKTLISKDAKIVDNLDDACDECEKIGYPCYVSINGKYFEMTKTSDFDKLVKYYSHQKFNGKVFKDTLSIKDS